MKNLAGVWNYVVYDMSQHFTRNAVFALTEELGGAMARVLPPDISVTAEKGVVTFSSDAVTWIRQSWVADLFDQSAPVNQRIIIVAHNVLNAGQDYVMEVTCDLWPLDPRTGLYIGAPDCRIEGGWLRVSAACAACSLRLKWRN